MNILRKVNDDILKNWLEFRNQPVLAYTTKEDKNILLNLMKFVGRF